MYVDGSMQKKKKNNANIDRRSPVVVVRSFAVYNFPPLPTLRTIHLLSNTMIFQSLSVNCKVTVSVLVNFLRL